jgi:iron complex outermembrane receptor protein
VERYVQEGVAYYGNPNLKPSRNLETDLGFETKILERLKFRTKGFYSYLGDYIYQEQKTSGVRTYTNIDAYLIGGDATAALDLSHGFGLEGGVAYQRGRKLSQPENNNDKDLAEICPLKAKLALNYDNHGFFAVYEWVHSQKSKDIDSVAGETPLKGWDVFNFRAGYQFSQKEGKLSFLNGLSLNFGVDNMFDKKYAVANSYEYDPTDPGGANVKIVNEPGRFIYGSLSYKF